jgi:hypothetical protein
MERRMSWKFRPIDQNTLKSKPGGGLVPPAGRAAHEVVAGRSNRQARRAARAKDRRIQPDTTEG